MNEGRSPFSSLILAALTAGALTATACTEKSDTDLQLTEMSQGIVNGVKEDEYPGVGALTLVMGEDYTGSFCTGTLIAPQWVVTAAHCVQGGYDRMGGREGAPDDTFFHFFVGSRADRRESGQLFQARQVYIHPGYTARGGRSYYDIAMMELAEPIADIDPYPLFEGDLTDFEGEEVFYTGFGMTDGVERSGGGVKHSKSLRIHRVYAATFSTSQNDGGVCFGDSGGPGLLMTEDGYRTVGVNSAAIGQVPCMGWSSQMRTDAYASWILDIMGEGASCIEDGDLCQCPEACGEDGVCDNSQCGMLRCGGFINCVRACEDPACQYGCYASMTPIEHHFADQLYACVGANCPEGQQFCVQTYCSRELHACYQGEEAATGDASCAATHWCAEECTTDACKNACFYEATFDAQDAYRPVEDCVEANCPDDALAMGRSDCIARQCRRPLLACLPPDGCSLTGQDCQEGEACVPAAWGATYCRATDGLEVGAACELSGVPCVEGALCLGSPAGAYCHRLCTTDIDCSPDGGACERRAAPGAPFPLGLCSAICRDADLDGTCDDADCAPEDASAYPGADEVCDNEADDDCDGLFDEGCVVCADDDGDGFCGEEDCDDADAETRPGADEVCGDDIDNNCDGVIDEECPVIEPDMATPAIEDGGTADETLPDSEPTLLIGDGGDGAGCDCSSTGGGSSLPLWCFLLVMGLARRRRFATNGLAMTLVAIISLLGLMGCEGQESDPAVLPDTALIDAGNPDSEDRDAGPLADSAAVTDAQADASGADILQEPTDAATGDLGLEDMSTEPDMEPAPPTISRIQRGLEAPGTVVTLNSVILASPFARGGAFATDGEVGPYSGLWLQIDGDLPDWPMGTTFNVTGTVTEFTDAPSADGGVPPTTQTRSQLTVNGVEDLARLDTAELPMPSVVSLGEFAIPDLAELFEGVLVSVTDVTVTRPPRGGVFLLNGTLSVDRHFVPGGDDWLVNGVSLELVTGILDYRDGKYLLVPRMESDLPRPPALLGDCFPIDDHYTLCPNGKPWPRARDTCTRNGGRIVVLETEEENLALGGLFRSWREGSFWIGLSDRGTEGEFIWINSSPLEYSGWAGGEPNDHGGGEDCAESNWRGPGEWNDAACRNERAFVCEYGEQAPSCEGADVCGPGECVDGVCRLPAQGE